MRGTVDVPTLRQIMPYFYIEASIYGYAIVPFQNQLNPLILDMGMYKNISGTWPSARQGLLNLTGILRLRAHQTRKLSHLATTFDISSRLPVKRLFYRS